MNKLALVVFARGAFIFLSEIEAHQAATASPHRVNGTVSAGIDLVSDAARRRQGAIAALPGRAPTGPVPERRWAMPLEKAEADRGGGCRVERIEPWPDAADRQSVVGNDEPLVAAAGGYDYAAFRIVNASGTSAPISVASRGGGSAVKWHALAYVQALDYRWIADAVVPFERAQLPPRSDLVLFAEVSPTAEFATPRIGFDIACGESTGRFDIPLRVIRTAQSVKPLHGTQWVYTHQKEQAHIAKALACEPNFLTRYGIDTQVVHPEALFETRNGRPDALLARYLSDFRGAKRLLLYMDVKSRPWAFKAMADDEAVRSLGAWWAWLNEQVRKAGVASEIVLYPIDEPQPGDEPLLRRTRELLRRAGISAPIYATLEPKSIDMANLLEIAQVQRLTPQLRAGLRSSESQLYEGALDGRQVSPNSYYRRQGWRAWHFDLAGVGYWALWDSSGAADAASGWSPFTGTNERDFGTMYQGGDGCGVPSRRLLAWRRGIEENRLLKACMSKAGHDPLSRRMVESAIEDASATTLRRALSAITKDCR